jgi:hypothetical protein
MSTTPHQPKLHYDDLDDALHDLVQALGGFKKVGPRLWPGMPQDDAAGRLRHCLNKTRREKLDPHELQLLLTWGREVEFHGAKHFIDDQTGYQRSAPLNPKDEERKAIEAVEAAAEALQRATESLERARARVTAPAARSSELAVVK